MATTYIFNTTIAPTPGLTYKTSLIKTATARKLVRDADKKGAVTSAIGHESTAAVASKLLGIHVPVNRVDAQVEAGDTIVAVKLRGRAPEGKILSLEEVEAIGYDLVLMEVSA